jgi:cytochrome c
VLADGRVLGGGLGASVRVWDLREAAAKGEGRALQPCALLQGHKGAVRALGQLEDGRLFSGGDDGDVRLWAVASLAQAGRLSSGAPVFAVAQLRTGGLVTGSADMLLRVWALPAAGVEVDQPLLMLRGHEGVISSVLALSPQPDGSQRCVSAGLDGLILMWDCSGGGAPLRRFRGHTGSVTGLAPGGAPGRIVSVSMDRTMREYDVEGGYAERVCVGHSHWVNAALALRDGRVLTAGADRTLRFWRRGEETACAVLRRPIGGDGVDSPRRSESDELLPSAASPSAAHAAAIKPMQVEAQATASAHAPALPMAIAGAAVLAAAVAALIKRKSGGTVTAPPVGPLVVHARVSR